MINSARFNKIIITCLHGKFKMIKLTAEINTCPYNSFCSRTRSGWIRWPWPGLVGYIQLVGSLGLVGWISCLAKLASLVQLI